ncbi:MAG: VanZ family protein [Acutalibacteraceae bacterium]
MSAYITSFMLYLFIFMIVYIPIKACINRKERIHIKNIIEDFIFYCYIILVLALTVLPLLKISFFDSLNLSLVFPSGQIVDISVNGIKVYSDCVIERTLQLKPFNTIINFLNGNYGNNIPPKVAFMRLASNLIGNIILFIPFGFLYPLRKTAGIIKTVGLGFGFILAIECFQYIEGRVADIDDIILNVLGVALGFLAYAVFKRIRIKHKN